MLPSIRHHAQHRRVARESETTERAIAVAIWNGRRREDSPTITGATLRFLVQASSCVLITAPDDGVQTLAMPSKILQLLMQIGLYVGAKPAMMLTGVFIVLQWGQTVSNVKKQ